MIEGPSGYREIEHTADWELEVWAPDLPGLLTRAAVGMYQLSGIQIQPGPEIEHEIDLRALDDESLLVSFLSELLYFVEEENTAFNQFQIVIQDGRLNARLIGALLANQDKEIKAVTFHNLKIFHELDQLKVRIVFDV